MVLIQYTFPCLDMFFKLAYPQTHGHARGMAQGVLSSLALDPRPADVVVSKGCGSVAVREKTFCIQPYYSHKRSDATVSQL